MPLQNVYIALAKVNQSKYLAGAAAQDIPTTRRVHKCVKFGIVSDNLVYM